MCCVSLLNKGNRATLPRNVIAWINGLQIHEGFKPETFMVPMRDACLAQTSLGTEEPAGGTMSRGMGKKHSPIAVTKDLLKLHPSSWSCLHLL